MTPKPKTPNTTGKTPATNKGDGNSADGKKQSTTKGTPTIDSVDQGVAEVKARAIEGRPNNALKKTLEDPTKSSTDSETNKGDKDDKGPENQEKDKERTEEKEKDEGKDKDEKKDKDGDQQGQEELPPGVKEGWTKRTADNGKGVVWQRPGAQGNADMVRIMDPTPRYPYGYVRFYNKHGQPINLDGKPGSRADTHIPRNPDGSYPVPKGW
ncbi:hypothetical protein [Thermocrispum sp.]|uniref:Bacterial toxin 24 domain-containing protein n=1 Tax=Thermocrispum agreste TaxID=37925 RepID=A0ABD6FA51_9PSEU|nr:hypothetical protein [Thermocrispum sp.]